MDGERCVEACRVRLEPRGREVRVDLGETLANAIRKAGVPLSSSCEGGLYCGFCAVEVLEGRERLSPPDSGEVQALAGLGPGPVRRLACCARIQAPGLIRVTTPYW